ncbi:MAG: DUF4013 domain-containing protein [Eggerthellaceae bacterium]
MQQGYYSTAWSDIKNSPGWFAKVCLLGLINFIPVFGSMVCYGYSYGWARDIAWNVHQPMPARLLGNEDGKLYSRGFFTLVIFLVASLVSVIPGIIIGDSGFSSLVVSLLSLFLCMFAAIGVMRMAIYGRISAGFQVKKMWAMMTHDFNGLLRILGMVILASLVIGFAFGIGFALLAVLFVVFCMLAVGGDISMYLFYDSASIDPSAIGAFAPAAIVCLILVLGLLYITSCASCWLTLLQARAMGYWTRQFDVASWRGQNDPMPFEAEDAAATAAAAAANAAAIAAAGAAAEKQPPSEEDPIRPVPATTAAPVADSIAQPAADELSGVPASGEVSAAEPIQPAEAPICPKCGQLNNPGSKFCVACGSKLSE